MTLRTDVAQSNQDERRLNRSARLVLLFALLFILFDLAQLAYRFTLPTEGWLVKDSDQGPDAKDFLVSQNLLGAPSPLQPGDALHIIGGIPSERIINNQTPAVYRPTGWQTGGRVNVTVIRNEQMLTFDIPLVSWTLSAWWQSNFGDFVSVMNWLSALILLGVGGFTFFNRPRNLAARFLFLIGVTSLATTLSSSLPDGIGSNFDQLAVMAKALFSFVIFAYLAGPTLLGFALTFPAPKTFIQHHPGWLVVPFMVGATAPLLLFVNPLLAAIGFPITLAMVIATVVSLIHSAMTMRDALSRAQMRWAVGGVVVGLGLFTLNYPVFLPKEFQLVLYAVASMGLPVMGISLAIAILRYRLFDIDIIIRRTLIYSIITALLVLFYFGSVVVLQQILRPLIGAESDLAIIISTLAIAALFNPLRHRVQDTIDHRFYRRKYDAQQVLARFAQTVRDEVELGKLTDELMNVVNETMQPTQVSMWLKKQEAKRE